MNRIEYIKLSDINPDEFIVLLNKQKTRAHLIEHPLFNQDSVKEWLESKIIIDSSSGCKVRAIINDKQLAGWCGIQLEDNKYELALVIDESYWGLGRQIFEEMMTWAKELGHQTVFIHFLSTRPEYKFLRKISKKVYESELLGSTFTTYELDVNTVA